MKFIKHGCVVSEVENDVRKFYIKICKIARRLVTNSVSSLISELFLVLILRENEILVH